MKYDLAIDCGGTKVLAILYDEQYRPVRVCRVGSIRSTTMPPEFIRKNVMDLLGQLQLKGLTVGVLSGVVVEPLVSEVQKVCTVERVRIENELDVGLAAADLQEGYLAICGTGATLACRYQGKNYSEGGYGSIVSDAGSGYWIAREAFEAAIKDHEQRGERTLLTDLIAQKLGGASREDFRRAVFTIYGRTEIPPITAVTACAPLVSEAAKAGDAVAYDILLRAGRVLAEQVNAVRVLNELPADLPVTVSGGVWKGHPVIFQEYCRILREKGMTGPFLLPEFEPVVGAILRQAVWKQGVLSEEDKNRFRTIYKDYLFQ